MSSQNTEAMVAEEPMPIAQVGPARVIRAGNLGEYPGLTGCTLEQSALGGSTLELEFAGGPPSWAQYWQQVTLVGTSGQALFTGQITNISTTNSGGSLYTAISVSDYWYLLERQTSATQISALLAQGSARTFRQSLSKQVESWTSLAGSVRIAAQGWVCSSTGEAYNGSVRLDVTKARYSVTPSVPRERFFATFVGCNYIYKVNAKTQQSEETAREMPLGDTRRLMGLTLSSAIYERPLTEEQEPSFNYTQPHK